MRIVIFLNNPSSKKKITEEFLFNEIRKVLIFFSWKDHMCNFSSRNFSHIFCKVDCLKKSVAKQTLIRFISFPNTFCGFLKHLFFHLLKISLKAIFLYDFPFWIMLIFFSCRNILPKGKEDFLKLFIIFMTTFCIHFQSHGRTNFLLNSFSFSCQKILKIF